MTDLCNQTINGYEFQEEIGKGGFGVVYRAFQPILKRTVAIKVILPEHSSNPDFIKRFSYEAELVARLEHPHIVPLFDYWHDTSGAYLVMRHIGSGTLAKALEKRTGGDIPQAIAMLQQLALGISVAHRHSIVHRDIKPENILLDDEGNAYVTDFGIAQVADIDPAKVHQGGHHASYRYASPEQMLGNPITPQTDIYSLGIVAYETLSGHHPYEHEEPNVVILRHIEEPLPDIREFQPDLPAEVNKVLQKATAKEPYARYRDIRDFVRELRLAVIPEKAYALSARNNGKLMELNHPSDEHIFVSYSHTDYRIVKQIIADLRDTGLHIWYDHIGLRPGTPDWEDALRQAIQSAKAVLYMGSPAARESLYIRDELAIADMYSIPVYPIWVNGESWVDCIPIGRGSMQYIDVRDEAYSIKLQTLINLLHDIANASEAKTPATSIKTPRNPYKGLQSFRARDHKDFFGRDTIIAKLIDSLKDASKTARLFAILGPSGSGKSSLAMAGLLPRLQQGAIPGSDNWYYFDSIVPGAHPLERLTILLEQHYGDKRQINIRDYLNNPNKRGLNTLVRQLSDQPVVLYIDQFEEVFTLVQHERERRQFIDLLCTAVTEPNGNLTVILTLRADFYDRPMQYNEFGNLIQTNHIAITPMKLADLYDVVQKPAELDDVGLIFDDGLISDMVFSVRSEVTALPLLQFTLQELFERRQGHRLTLEAYHAIGKVQGALAQHAENTYKELPSDQHRTMARVLFMRLIEPGVTEQDATRRRTTYDELTLDDPARTDILWETVRIFVNARLLFTNQNEDEATIEVSHEAVINQWQRLQDWVHDAREDLRFRKNLTNDVFEWLRRDRDEAILYRGIILTEALAWSETHTPNRNEMAFIKASEAYEKAQKERDQQLRARLRTLVFGLIGVTLLGAFVLVLIFGQNNITLREEANYINAQIAWVSTRAVGVGGLPLDLIDLTLTPAPDFLATATAQSRIWTPEIAAFNCDDGYCVEMAQVPPGCFWMGSMHGETDERPVHEICFDAPFWIDVYEVSNDQFDALDGIAEGIKNWSEPQQPRTVTWLEAYDFCQKRGARLPTEAEWLYVAQGPESRTYTWGSQFDADKVALDLHEPLAVGSLDVTSWVGTYDMNGNVWEWVNTIYASFDEFGALEEKHYPYTQADGREAYNETDSRVLLGGSFNNDETGVRSGNRFRGNPDVKSNTSGFRCARNDPR